MSGFIKNFTMNGYGSYVLASFFLVIFALFVLQILAGLRLKKALTRARYLEEKKV